MDEQKKIGSKKQTKKATELKETKGETKSRKQTDRDSVWQKQNKIRTQEINKLHKRQQTESMDSFGR